MDSRKRPHDGDGPVSVKKRVLLSSSDSPMTPVSPSAVADEPQNAEIESFRKEAIYRRMQHYSRELERSQHVVSQLESKTLSYEAALVAIETCWDQLLQQVRLLVKPGELQDVEDQSALFALAQDVDAEGKIGNAYMDAIKAKESLTVNTIRAVVASTPALARPDVQDLQNMAHRLRSQLSSISGELALTKAKLEESVASVETYRELLSTAENRLERLKSTTVQKLEAKPQPKEEPEPSSQSNGNGTLVKAEPMQTTAPDMNGHVSSEEVEEWKYRAEERLRTIEDFQKEHFELRQQISKLKTQLVAPSSEVLTSLHLYKSLQSSVDTIRKAEESQRAEVKALRDYILRMEESRSQFQAQAQAEANAKVNDLRTLLEKKESDLLRLRENRDTLSADLLDRKARESTRDGSLNQSKILANARGERIAMLVSENHRLKARLAAREGEETFFAFIMSNPQDESFVRAQEERVDMLQRANNSLNATLKALGQGNPDVENFIQVATEAKEQAEALRTRLEKFEALYGPDAIASSSVDLQQLSEQLRCKEEELRKLRLELKASLEEPTALYTEIERLSALWENLDKQLKSKIFDLGAMEDKLTKAQTEKSKADNKYFAAMRELDALKAVVQHKDRENKKQSLVQSKLVDSEKALKEQLAHLERETHLQAKSISERDTVIARAQIQIDKERASLELSNRRVQELNTQVLERDDLIAKHRLEVNKLNEKCESLRRQADAKVAQARAANATGYEAELVKERDSLMSILKCSTCKLQYRKYVLTKCMHTFCKDCIDARLTTRQRKCPACNGPFANSDVQELWFQ